MQIKKFVGENITQTMALVKKEMGNDAIILQTKKTKSKGFLGFFKKDMVEVLAAIEPDKSNSRLAKTKSSELSLTKGDYDKKNVEDGGFTAHIDGKNNKNDVMVYGIDGTPEIKALIGRNQMIVGTVAQSPIKMGQIAVENMYNILNGKKIEKNIIIPISLINKENLFKYDEDRWQ